MLSGFAGAWGLRLQGFGGCPRAAGLPATLRAARVCLPSRRLFN